MPDKFGGSIMGALIQGWWYVHIISLLTSTCIGTCTYYVQPVQVPRYVHVPASKQHVPMSVQRYVAIPEQTILILTKHVSFIIRLKLNKNLLEKWQGGDINSSYLEAV